MSARKPQGDVTDPSFQIGPGMWVRLRYEVFDEEGERVEDAPQELEYVHGRGALLPALEAALEGRPAKDACRVTLSPGEAFGPRRKEAVVELSPEEFPSDVAPGDRFDAETEDGRLVVLCVLEVHPEVLVVDTNHPLSGQRVRFELGVLEVRPASAEELSQAEGEASEPSAHGPLIAAERLLRGASRRYELAGPGGSRTPRDEES